MAATDESKSELAATEGAVYDNAVGKVGETSYSCHGQEGIKSRLSSSVPAGRLHETSRLEEIKQLFTMYSYVGHVLLIFVMGIWF